MRGSTVGSFQSNKQKIFRFRVCQQSLKVIGERLAFLLLSHKVQNDCREIPALATLLLEGKRIVLSEKCEEIALSTATATALQLR